MSLRLGTTIAVLVAAAVLAATLVGGLGAGGSAAKPRLTVLAQQPFVVVGTGFRGGETVRVSVRGEAAPASKTGTASAAGRIAVRFPRLALDECSYYVVAARGNKGSRAGLRSIPRPCGIEPRRAP